MNQRIDFAQARLEQLDEVHRMVDEVCTKSKLDESTCYAIRLSVEEAFVNIVDHGYHHDMPGPITIRLESDANQITATIIDRSPPFAPESAPAPDLSVNWQERQIGGLGWHLIRQMMDEIHYETDDAGNNRLTLIKNLSNSRAPDAKRERLEITVSPRNSVTVVALGGRIDALGANSLKQVLENQMAEGKNRLVLDLARVTYISSAGVYVFLQGLRSTRQGAGDLRVTNATREVRKVLDLSGFTSLAKFYADVDAAAQSFRQ